ncbi:MAG TPA: PH domain-containing protein [Thermoanaerobaculia bacterium]|nr:PH domain-containing protein [Thermoanaerobaculia bacterium]
MTELTFRSRIDRWLVVVLLASFSIPLLVILPLLALTDEVDRWSVLLVLALLALNALFVVWLFRSTYYVLTVDELLVRSGPFRWRVPLTAITRVRPSRSLLSAPALSLDRLEIRYDGDTLLISPREKEEFLRALGGRVAPGALAR